MRVFVCDYMQTKFPILVGNLPIHGLLLAILLVHAPTATACGSERGKTEQSAHNFFSQLHESFSCVHPST